MKWLRRGVLQNLPGVSKMIYCIHPSSPGFCDFGKFFNGHYTCEGKYKETLKTLMGLVALFHFNMRESLA